ncbi:Thiamin pyrophosphokinase 1, partial [Stegodyphus mimosarum]
MCIVLGTNVVSCDTVKVWYQKFKNKDYDIQKAEHSGWPTDVDKAHLQEFVEEDQNLISSSVIIMELQKGSHKVHISDDVKDSHLGLIPLGKECTNVSTTGLKWNLNGDRMKFGGLISTCNLFDGSRTVTVTTDTELIWTMEIKLNLS